jgi:hypothetical protein
VIGFAYFKLSTNIHRSLTQHLPRNDLTRFGFGTVTEAESTMMRVFTVAPSNEQIVTDILRLETVLDMIIKERGAIVPELNFRRGHRAFRHDKKGVMKNALKKSSRVSTYSLPAMHPDATAAVEQLRLRAARKGAAIEISSAEDSGSGSSTDDDENDSGADKEQDEESEEDGEGDDEEEGA